MCGEPSKRPRTNFGIRPPGLLSIQGRRRRLRTPQDAAASANGSGLFGPGSLAGARAGVWAARPGHALAPARLLSLHPLIPDQWVTGSVPPWGRRPRLRRMPPLPAVAAPPSSAPAASPWPRCIYGCPADCLGLTRESCRVCEASAAFGPLAFRLGAAPADLRSDAVMRVGAVRYLVASFGAGSLRQRRRPCRSPCRLSPYASCLSMDVYRRDTTDTAAAFVEAEQGVEARYLACGRYRASCAHALNVGSSGET